MEVSPQPSKVWEKCVLVVVLNRQSSASRTSWIPEDGRVTMKRDDPHLRIYTYARQHRRRNERVAKASFCLTKMPLNLPQCVFESPGTETPAAADIDKRECVCGPLQYLCQEDSGTDRPRPTDGRGRDRDRCYSRD